MNTFFIEYNFSNISDLNKLKSLFHSSFSRLCRFSRRLGDMGLIIAYLGAFICLASMTNSFIRNYLFIGYLLAIALFLLYLYILGRYLLFRRKIINSYKGKRYTVEFSETAISFYIHGKSEAVQTIYLSNVSSFFVREEGIVCFIKTDSGNLPISPKWVQNPATGPNLCYFFPFTESFAIHSDSLVRFIKQIGYSKYPLEKMTLKETKEYCAWKKANNNTPAINRGSTSVIQISFDLRRGKSYQIIRSSFLKNLCPDWIYHYASVSLLAAIYIYLALRKLGIIGKGWISSIYVLGLVLFFSILGVVLLIKLIGLKRKSKTVISRVVSFEPFYITICDEKSQVLFSIPYANIITVKVEGDCLYIKTSFDLGYYQFYSLTNLPALSRYTIYIPLTEMSIKDIAELSNMLYQNSLGRLRIE